MLVGKFEDTGLAYNRVRYYTYNNLGVTPLCILDGGVLVLSFGYHKNRRYWIIHEDHEYHCFIELQRDFNRVGLGLYNGLISHAGCGLPFDSSARGMFVGWTYRCYGDRIVRSHLYGAEELRFDHLGFFGLSLKQGLGGLIRDCKQAIENTDVNPSVWK